MTWNAVDVVIGTTIQFYRFRLLHRVLSVNEISSYFSIFRCPFHNGQVYINPHIWSAPWYVYNRVIQLGIFVSRCISGFHSTVQKFEIDLTYASASILTGKWSSGTFIELPNEINSLFFWICWSSSILISGRLICWSSCI